MGDTTAPTLAPTIGGNDGIVQGSISCGDIVSGTTIDGISLHGNPAPDHAYSFTVTSSATNTGNSFQFSTCGSSFDTFVRIFDSDWNEIEGCDDCGDCGLQTILEVPDLEVGDYYVVVEGYSDLAGDY